MANMYTMFSGCFNQLYSATGIAPPNFQVLAPPQGQSQAMLPASQGIDGFLPVPLQTFPSSTHIQTGLLAWPIAPAPSPAGPVYTESSARTVHEQSTVRTTMELGTDTLEAPEALAATSTTTTETIVPPTGETKFIVHSVTIYVFKYIYIMKIYYLIDLMANILYHKC